MTDSHILVENTLFVFANVIFIFFIFKSECLNVWHLVNMIGQFLVFDGSLLIVTMFKDDSR